MALLLLHVKELKSSSAENGPVKFSTDSIDGALFNLQTVNSILRY